MTCELRPVGVLAYQLGLLHTDYEDALSDGELADDFTIYDSFHDIHIDENPYLRRLAGIRGRIDALTYLVKDETPPTESDWVVDEPDQVLKNVEETLTTVCTERGGQGCTWTDYLRGWVQALHYAFSRTTAPTDRVRSPVTR